MRHRNLRNLNISACHSSERTEDHVADFWAKRASFSESAGNKNPHPKIRVSTRISRHPSHGHPAGEAGFGDVSEARNTREQHLSRSLSRARAITGEKTALFADAEEPNMRRVSSARGKRHTQQMHANRRWSRARPEAPVQSRWKVRADASTFSSLSLSLSFSSR